MWNGVRMTKTVWPTRPKILTIWSATEKSVLIPVLVEELNPTVVSSGREKTSFGETHGHGDLYRGWGGLCKEMLTQDLKNGGSYHTDFQGGRAQQV